MNNQNQIIDQLADEIIRTLFEGGSGSGNWGHSGRPGIVGGSQPTRAGSIFKQGITKLGWHTGGERGGLTSFLFKSARLSATVRALASGNPIKIARRAANIVIGRKAVSHLYLKGKRGEKSSW
jgi:hypothetical protein